MPRDDDPRGTYVRCLALCTVQTGEHNRCVKSIPSILVLCRPTTAYAPWFGVVLKTARLAVSMISILSEEVSSYGPLSDTMQSSSISFFRYWRYSCNPA